MFRELAQRRQSMRLRDIEESRQLLWELATYEPTLLNCLSILESTCLSQVRVCRAFSCLGAGLKTRAHAAWLCRWQGVVCKVDGDHVSDEFQGFIDEHYVQFCRDAIRALVTYGFVPWVQHRLSTGDVVPMVLPHGTFLWFTEVKDGVEASVKQCAEPGPVGYRVKVCAAMKIEDKDVRISGATCPSLDVSVNSILYATVPSPLSHVLTDYKNLRQAQIRRAHADSWNTTSKLICSFNPTVRVQEDPSASLMDFADDAYFQPSMHLGIPGMPPTLVCGSRLCCVCFWLPRC